MIVIAKKIIHHAIQIKNGIMLNVNASAKTIIRTKKIIV